MTKTMRKSSCDLTEIPARVLCACVREREREREMEIVFVEISVVFRANDVMIS